MSIFHKLFHTVVAYVPIPEIVYQHILEAHRCCEIDELDLVVIVDASVLPQDPAPGALPESVGMLRFVTWFHDIPGDGALRNRLERTADRNCTPRGSPGDGECRLHGAVAVILFRHGELDPVASLRVPVAQAAAAIAAVDACLADERPSVLPDLEEAGKCISVAVLRLFT